MKLEITLADVLAKEFDSQLRAVIEMLRERARQDQKFGDQSKLPDLCPVLTLRHGGATPERFAEDLEIPTTTRARELCEAAKESGCSHFGAILVEEVAEAIEQAALKDPVKLREELVQVGAVVLLWLETLDKRGARK